MNGVSYIYQLECENKRLKEKLNTANAKIKDVVAILEILGEKS